MAGGSADAAAALLGCASLWGLELSRDQLSELAAELGSDVPFALTGGTAVGTGRGERLSPVLSRMRLHWVLALARTGLATPAVFAELDRLRAAGDPPRVGELSDVLAALASGDPATGRRPRSATTCRRRGESCCLALRDTLRAGLAAGALGGMVSGSGPTVALLCAVVGVGRRGGCRTGRIRHLPGGPHRVRTGARGSAPQLRPLISSRLLRWARADRGSPGADGHG